MARLEARRIPVLRTDLDGEIDLDTDGRRVTVRTVDQGP
jgi:beta-lactamase superfamily II metal-dependent hydrolase